MNNRTLTLGIIGIVFAILVGLVALFFYKNFEWKEEKYKTNYSGEAVSNPYHAAELLMQKLDFKTEKIIDARKLTELPGNATLVLSSSSYFGLRDEARQKALIDWVRAGGHLLVDVTPMGNKTHKKSSRHDEDDPESMAEEELVKRPQSLSFLEKLGIETDHFYSRPTLNSDAEEVDKRRASTSEERRGGIRRQRGADFDTSSETNSASDSAFDAINIDDKSIHADLSDAYTFTLSRPPVWQVQLPESISYYRYRALSRCNNSTSSSPDGDGDDEDDDENCDGKNKPLVQTGKQYLQLNTVIARYHEGRGWVTAVTLQNFDNYNLPSQQNAELFVRLATLPDESSSISRPIYFSLAPDFPTLTEWLLQNARDVLLALAALILIGIWYAMPRFGPLRPAVSADRPGLLPHLRAVGEFHIRHRDYAALITPLREELMRALLPLRAHYPEIRNMPQLAAHVTGISIQEITQALEKTPYDRISFAQYTRTLTDVLDYLRGHSKTQLRTHLRK